MMSKGPGRRQRRILKLLDKAPGHRLSRAEIEAELVEGPFDSSNTLRAIRGLVRQGRAIFNDRADKSESFVSFPPEVPALDEDEVFALINQSMNRDQGYEGGKP
jgi:hypothetical protein